MKINLSRRFSRPVIVSLIAFLAVISIAKIGFATTVVESAGINSAPASVTFSVTAGQTVALPQVYPGAKNPNGTPVLNTIFDCGQIVEGKAPDQTVRECRSNDSFKFTVRGSQERVSTWKKLLEKARIKFQ